MLSIVFCCCCIVFLAIFIEIVFYTAPSGPCSKSSVYKGNSINPCQYWTHNAYDRKNINDIKSHFFSTSCLTACYGTLHLIICHTVILFQGNLVRLWLSNLLIPNDWELELIDVGKLLCSSLWCSENSNQTFFSSFTGKRFLHWDYEIINFISKGSVSFRNLFEVFVGLYLIIGCCVSMITLRCLLTIVL